jgi:hypothetical protein
MIFIDIFFHTPLDHEENFCYFNALMCCEPRKTALHRVWPKNNPAKSTVFRPIMVFNQLQLNKIALYYGRLLD